MEGVDVESSLVSEVEPSSEIDECVEVVSSVQVSLVPNETEPWLPSDGCGDVGKDILFGDVGSLSVGQKKVFTLKTKRHTELPQGSRVRDSLILCFARPYA